MFKFVLILITLFLSGCDNAVLNNSGAVPPIEFTGSIWAGNVRYAKVQFVGVDRYGQPQRQSDGTFYGDSYYSDGAGQFSVSIGGSYAGSLIAVASYAEAGSVIKAATADTEAVVTPSQTEIRCVLPSGCKDEAGAVVPYGTWYPAPGDFQMWGALSSVIGLEVFYITPVTHLAAMLAFNQPISDGTNCNDSPAACLTSEFKDSIFTPETIYRSNSRVKEFFLLETGFHINTQPWYEGVSALTDIEETQFAKHGLIAMALQLMSKQALAPSMNNKTMDALNWWVDSFLNRDGNLYVDSNANEPSDLDVELLFQAVIDIHDEYDAEGKSSAGLDLAAQAFYSQLQTLTTNPAVGDVMPFTDVEFSESTLDKISKAQELVAEVKNWAEGFKTNQYQNFFDQSVADKLVATEDDWALYNQTLSPIMKGLFKPIIKVAEYALTCVIDSACNDQHNLYGITGVSFDSASEQVTFTKTNPGSVEFDGETFNYTAINIVGSFNSNLGQSDSKKIFELTEASLTVTGGSVNLLAVNGINPQVTFYLNPQKENKPYQIDFMIPELLVASDTADAHQLKATDFSVIMLGTLDAVIGGSEYHYNIESIDFFGKFTGLGGNGDALDLRFTLNSENAQTYYSPNRFPDLEINIDSTAFKNYTKLGADAAGFISNQGGWFTLPKNVSESELPVNSGQKIVGAVTFNIEGGYDAWDSEYDSLKSILNIDNTASATLGSLLYPSGETALIIYKVNSIDSTETARQCNKVGENWGCQAALPVSSLGCGNELGLQTVSVLSAFDWLKSEGCLGQVKIDGRGIYDIEYGDLSTSFVHGDVFPATLNEPEYLGIESLYIDLISRFVASDENLPVARLVLSGAMPDLENVALGLSLTHDYSGGTSGSSLGVDDLIPYGENSIWLAVAQSSSSQDALIYYFQDGSITMTVFGFDYADVDADSSGNISYANSSHDQPLAVIRYDGQLLGTLRREGDLYVIRYINGNWQIL